MDYKPMTPDGHTLSDVRSALQKSIRRGDERVASYCAWQMHERYNKYLWKTLLVVSAEDCYGCVTKEVLALRDAEYECRKKDGKVSPIFIAKAVTLLLRCEKSRDADYVACNLLDAEDVDISNYINVENPEPLYDLPDYVYDCHTYKGRAMGKTRQDFIQSEFEALANRQVGLFDDWEWR